MSSTTQTRRNRHSEKQTKPQLKWPWILLAVALLFAAFVRIRLLQIPFERDEGEFAYMGQLMLHGIAPYKIAFNMKMPGIYAAYALIMAVFGQTIGGVHLGFMLVNLTTIVLIFLLTKRLFGAVAGGAAALAYSVLSVYPSYLGTSAHATHFVLVFALAGMLIMFKATESKRESLYFLSGVLFGTSFLMKQPGGLFGVLAFGFCAWDELKNRSPWRQATTKLGLLVVGGFAPLAATVVLLWRAGVLDSFYFWTFTYLRTYAAQIPLNYVPPIFWGNTCMAVDQSGWLYIPALIGLVVLFADRNLRRHAAFAVAFLLMSFLAVCPGFYFRSHYFVLILPAIAMLGGVAVSWAMEKISGGNALGSRALLPAALYALVLILPVYKGGEFLFTMTPERACRSMYGANPFVESLEIARYIKSHTTKNDTIAVIGSEPQIYFYSQRRAAVTYIYMYPLMETNPFAQRMQQQLIKQIETARPKYLVFVATPTSWCQTAESDRSIHNWLPGYGEKHYRLVGLVESLAQNWIDSYWGDDAIGRLPTTSFYVSVLVRKEP